MKRIPRYPALKPMKRSGSGGRGISGSLPAGARGLFLVGLASAAMSTLDTDLLWGSTVIVKNFVHEIGLVDAGPRAG